MTIRLKILSIALALLLIFGVVVGVSAILQHQVTDQIGGITEYHQALTELIADVDVGTDDYELLPLRLLRLPSIDPGELAKARARASDLVAHLAEDFHRMAALIDEAIADDRLPFHDRLVFARLQPTVGFLQKRLEPFLKTGQDVTTAIAEGRIDAARVLSQTFRQYEEAFGPDMADARRKITSLTSDATLSAYRKQAAIQYMSFGLFALAAMIGLGVGAAVSTGVVRALRRVLDGTKAVEAGELAVMIPVHTRDELGELALAFNRMVVQLRTKNRITDTFGKFVDPRIVAGLIGEQPDAIDHAERRVVTVFFSDIEGFTTISEQLTATTMINLLNHYFAAVTDCIRTSGGIVDKYIGDALMAFWTPPFSPADSHAAAACTAALAQREAIVQLHKTLPDIVGLRRNAPNLVVRMGIATGEVVVGTIGSPSAKSFTVIGDTVNLASRLEGVNKIYGTGIIISDETLRLARSEIETREIDLITVAGRSEPVRLHELMGAAGQLSPADAELRDEFARGLAAYRARRWDEAEQAFRKCRTISPDDGPAETFLERIVTFRTDPPPETWDGVWRLTRK